LRIHYRPVLFAGLLKAHAHKGPAEIPAKRRFTYRFLVWQARKLGVPFKFPAVHPFNPLPLLRLAIAADCDPDAVRRIFRFVWRDGRLGDLPIEWAELMSELHLPDAQERIDSPEVKAALRRNTDDAIAKGVFGVPTLAIGDELFWGADATAMARRRGRRVPLTDPEMARVRTADRRRARRGQTQRQELSLHRDLRAQARHPRTSAARICSAGGWAPSRSG
jgi:2-hydroxychromene-2-carboxylate isomerase